MNTSTGSSAKISVLIGILTVILLVATNAPVGMTWDEPAYVQASETYTGWISRVIVGPHGVLNQGVVERAWTPNHEHPPADKIMSGIVWEGARYLFDDLLAHRLGNILLVGLTVALLYILVADELGTWAGLASVLALLAMPRFFFHAHLAALDVPAACMIVIVTFLFWRTKESARIRYTLFLGLVFGLAVATKVNAAFILPTLFLWVLLFRRKWYLVIRLVFAGAIGVGVFFAVWPWLYYDTINRVTAFIQFQTAAHWQIAQYYLGQLYMPPPWHFAFVMLFAVVPLGTLIFAGVGIVRSAVRRRDRAFGSMVLLNVLVPLLILAAGKTMIYDDDRLLMAAFPFLAVLTGAGFGWLVVGIRALFHRIHAPVLTAVLAPIAAVLLFLSPALQMISLFPHLLSYYSEGVGGLPGATKLGLETTYWCESYLAAMPYINEHASAGDIVWVEPWSQDILIYYQNHGILRKDVTLAIPEGFVSVFPENPSVLALGDYQSSKFVIVQFRQAQFSYFDNHSTGFLPWIQARSPVFQISYDGVPIMEIIQN